MPPAIHILSRIQEMGVDNVQRASVGSELVQPDVFLEIVDIMLNLANKGADVLRLDAVAFLWKRMGTW